MHITITNAENGFVVESYDDQLARVSSCVVEPRKRVATDAQGAVDIIAMLLNAPQPTMSVQPGPPRDCEFLDEVNRAYDRALNRAFKATPVYDNYGATYNGKPAND